MQRILVTGSVCSGKSTLSKELSQRLSIPVFHLDHVFWDPGWKRPSAEESQRRLREILHQESWVIDGVSQEAFAAADMVIFLDMPRWISYIRLVKRTIVGSFMQRTDVHDGSSDLAIFKKAATVIWQFPAKHRPGILAQINSAKDAKHILHLRTSIAAQEILKKLR